MLTRLQTQNTRPRMLLAYSDAAYASQCGRTLRRLGWEVHMVSSGEDARELAYHLSPDVVVLETALIDQSGWLTSAKISLDRPSLRIILVADEFTIDTPERLAMVGADQSVSRADGADALAELVDPQPHYV